MSDLEAREVITLQARRIAGDTAGRDVDLLDSAVVLPDERTWMVADFPSHLVVAYHGLSLPQLAACMVLAAVNGD